MHIEVIRRNMESQLTQSLRQNLDDIKKEAVITMMTVIANLVCTLLCGGSVLIEWMTDLQYRGLFVLIALGCIVKIQLELRRRITRINAR